jgi:hypothetical protein
MFDLLKFLNAGDAADWDNRHQQRSSVMGQLKPYQSRSREKTKVLSAEECRQRANELFASAEEMAPGSGRQSTLKEACDYRMLAELKSYVPPAKNSNPAS